jgi:uncharacterized membrane protein HdeD (DUF308 family)
MLADILSRNWWMVLVRGLVWILFGVVVFAWPGISLISITLFFGATLLLDGILSVANGIRGRKEHDDWWILLLIGLAGVAVGLFAVLNPGVASLALIFYIAIWAVATGLMQILAAIRLRKVIEGELWLVLGGLATVIFGILLASNPAAGALAVLWLIGAYAVAFGIILVLLSFKVRGVARRVSAARA